MVEMKGKAGASRARSIAFVGLTVAMVGVSAWIAVPFGPIMLTLQMFALAFAIAFLRPTEAVVAVFAYVVLGAVGAPVFSGGRGGLGVVLGPSGGYIFGYLVGVLCAALLLHFAYKVLDGREKKRRGVRSLELGFYIAAGLLFTAVSYVGGWLQFMLVMGVGPEAAFVATIAPFLAFDILKVIAASLCAQAVKRALRL